MQANLKTLTKALDKNSYEWLALHDPDILAGIEQAIAAGAGVADIRQHVLMHTHRLELAMRCEQAARHVKESE